MPILVSWLYLIETLSPTFNSAAHMSVIMFNFEFYYSFGGSGIAIQ